MESWSFEILRQRGVDLWMLVCVVAAALALWRVVAGRLWEDRRRAGEVMAAGVAAIGTLLVVAVPGLHRPGVGLVWTVLCLWLVVYVFYGGMIASLGPWRGGLLLGMRAAVIGLLVLMLFEPMVRYTQTRRPDRPLYLLVDASGSMSVPDVQNGPTRISAVWETLRGQMPTLEQHFDVKVRTFAGTVKELGQVEDLAAVVADGEATDLVKAIAHVLDETPRRDAQIVLISDGIDNVSGEVARAVGASQRPVHTLAVGSEQTQSTAVQNLAVESVDVEEELSVGHETKLKVVIRSTALANRIVDVRWAQVNEEGKPLAGEQSQKLVLSPKPEGQRLELPYRPTSVGLQRIAVWVDPIPGERTAIDNRQELQALALDPRIKVLYIEGRARPEYRELRRALDRDANVEVASLLRIQNDRFAASGSLEGRPVTGIPTAAEAWRRADVIIIGDLDASFLTQAQQAGIEQAVSEGTGLLMIGGQASFGPGAYEGTAVERALPVFSGGRDAAQEKTTFVPTLTNEGAMHPAMEGLGDWFARAGGEAAKRELTPVRGNVVVPRAKSGASVLLVHEARAGPDGRPQIILATQQYGKGRSAAFTADTTYLWYLSMREMGQESPYNRFWGQLVRWLAGADVRQRQQGAGLDGMLTRSVYQLGEAVTVKALVRDERGDATRFAEVRMELRRDGAEQAEPAAQLSPVDHRTGLYEVRIPQVDAGQWTMTLRASKDGKPLGEQTLKFTVLPPADELVQLAADHKLMAEIAQRTKGWAYPLAQAPMLVRQLISSDSEGTPVRQVVVPLANVARWVPAVAGRPADWALRYDLPMQATLVVGLLLGEWLLRRRWVA